MIINKRIILLTMGIFLFAFCANVFAEICATHVYHNHMPNFWPYYDTDSYLTTNVGEPIRYTYDGDVIELKKNPPADYTYYLPNGTIMPHDDLVAYYSHHAKVGAYLYWPWRTTENMNYDHPYAQKHVTMSGAVVNNVNNIIYHQNVEGYDNPDWNGPWKNTYNNVKTVNNYRALDLIHFTGHHTMGPLVGRDYMLKDLIFHNVTLAQNYFLGSDFKSSKGFFPTELGFSERIIPTLKKLGIEWTVLGNVHYSRILVDYPYLNDPGVDCLISPPNRADLQNRSDIGSWVARQMYNEQQVTHNKFPFASTPHYVKYVDPETGEEMKIAGIPVEQAASWEEGYQGSVTADFLKDFESLTDPAHPQFFVIAHDGDNSSGRAGDEGTWNNAAYVTYQNGVIGMGVDEYLHQYPLDPDDVVHQEAPSVPTNLCINSTSATSISLVWTAATDNVGVQGYKVYRNGVEVGTTVNTNYTDTGLNPDTDYSYTVKAFDNAGNTSTDSNTVIGSTDNGNIVTIYYKHGYTNPYIHYSPLGGSWTTPPGVLMDESEYANYSKITIEIGSASGIEAVFTDGNGNWDNNWGQNYIFPSGTSTFENGQIFEGTPQ